MRCPECLEGDFDDEASVAGHALSEHGIHLFGPEGSELIRKATEEHNSRNDRDRWERDSSEEEEPSFDVEDEPEQRGRPILGRVRSLFSFR